MRKNVEGMQENVSSCLTVLGDRTRSTGTFNRQINICAATMLHYNSLHRKLTFLVVYELIYNDSYYSVSILLLLTDRELFGGSWLFLSRPPLLASRPETVEVIDRGVKLIPISYCWSFFFNLMNIKILRKNAHLCNTNDLVCLLCLLF